MRYFAGALLAAAISGSALAQPPEVIETAETLQIGIGEARGLRFHESIAAAGTVTQGIAQITPQSDREITIAGLALGRTTMIVTGTDGKTIYRADVQVGSEKGHLVKIYSPSKDFVGVYCNAYTCGRPDLDVKAANGGRDPDAPSVVTVTQPTRNGGSVTTQYGR